MSEQVRIVGTAAHYGRVPESILLAKDATSDECRLYAYLSFHDWRRSGECHPGRQRMADDLSWSVSKVQRTLRALEAREAIDRRQGGRGHPGKIVLLADVITRAVDGESPVTEQPMMGQIRPDGGSDPESSPLYERERTTTAAPLSPLPGIEDAPAAEPRARKPRARDPIFDALTDAWGARPPALFGKIKRELIQTYGDEVTPEEIQRRSHEAQARYDDVSPNVLVTRWPDLVPKGRRDATGRDRAPGDWDGEEQTTVRERPRT